jgi:YD repeat-containing protein
MSKSTLRAVTLLTVSLGFSAGVARAGDPPKPPLERGGRPLTGTDAEGHKAWYRYDASGALVETRDAAGRLVTPQGTKPLGAARVTQPAPPPDAAR